MKFSKFLEIPGNLVKFAEICGISAFLRKNAIRAENDQKYIPFRFIIATFWSVGGKRSPFSRNLQNFSEFANFLKFIKFLEISGNLVEFTEIYGISAFLRKSAIRAEMTRNAIKIAL